MSSFEIIMPKMGESVQEATITRMFVKVNDVVEEDDLLFEIATDKVDSEIPSPVAGRVIDIRYHEQDLVAVGQVVAVIAMGASAEDEVEKKDTKHEEGITEIPSSVMQHDATTSIESSSGRFYSPLVKSIAKKENITLDELESITGHGKNGRVQKQDLFDFIAQRKAHMPLVAATSTPESVGPSSDRKREKPTITASLGAEDQIIEMDRMRRLIADHMVMSKQTSAHVTAMVEADVTNLVLWRNKIKEEFLAREKTKITYMPVFIEAVAQTLKEFPMINSSVDGYNVILKRDINIGFAVALDSGNLIVPVIKRADQKNLVGLAHQMNQLADKARNNLLSPDDIQMGTFTITNFGSFRNVMGTPIINQPQVAILAVGSIEKKPAVMETSLGDVIVPRHKMFLSLSYDHRVVDGALGGAFLRKIADYLEDIDVNRKI